MAEALDRRKGQWQERTLASFGIGPPVAILVGWVMQVRYNITMPQEVAMALGGVITGLVVCISSVFNRICPFILTIIRALKRKPK